MHRDTSPPQVPVYTLEPDPDRVSASSQFRLYTYEGTFPNPADLLVPHRKGHYLIVFIRHAGGRQWIDMTPYLLEDNTVYFTRPGQIIVKEEFRQLWSTGIAFTREFLALQESDSLSQLPLLQNPRDVHALPLAGPDVAFVEETLARIKEEYEQATEWQGRMLAAHLTVLLTYLSRLYSERFADTVHSADTLLLKRYQAKIDESFRELHQVGDYASLLHISAGHLSEVVKLQSGKPAIKHIHDRLVLEARRLLFHTPQPLKEIAFGLGFSDVSYFIRFFKRETGITPAGYRTAIREMYR